MEPTLTPATPTPSKAARRRAHRRGGRLFLGAAAVTLSASVLGGIGGAAAHAEERIAKTTPKACDQVCATLFADSDGDGASDFYEIMVGTDPYNAESRPPAELTKGMLDHDLAVTVRLDNELNPFVTVLPELVDVNVDTIAAPDGTTIVSSTLVDPLTGQALTTNHYGIDAKAAGIDVAALAGLVQSDPASIANLGVADLTLPSETPSSPPTNPNDPGIYSDDEGDGEDPGATPDGPPAANPDDGGAQPDDGGDDGGAQPDDPDNPDDPGANPDDGGDDGDGAVAGNKKELPDFDQQQKNKKEAEAKSKETTIWEDIKNAAAAAKCKLTPGCTSGYSDPDAAGGSGGVTFDPSNPPSRIVMAPEDYGPDGPQVIETPSTPPTNPNTDDPTVSDPDPDDTSGTTILDPGNVRPSVAPMDPPKPGTEGGGEGLPFPFGLGF